VDVRTATEPAIFAVLPATDSWHLARIERVQERGAGEAATYVCLQEQRTQSISATTATAAQKDTRTLHTMLDFQELHLPTVSNGAAEFTGGSVASCCRHRGSVQAKASGRVAGVPHRACGGLGRSAHLESFPPRLPSQSFAGADIITMAPCALRSIVGPMASLSGWRLLAIVAMGILWRCLDAGNSPPAASVVGATCYARAGRTSSCRMLRLRGGSQDAKRSAGTGSARTVGGGWSAGGAMQRASKNTTSARQTEGGVWVGVGLAGAMGDEEVALPSLDSFNISDETSVLKVKLALAQAEVLHVCVCVSVCVCVCVPQVRPLGWKTNVSLSLPPSSLFDCEF
jgi:hypothetical protein